MMASKRAAENSMLVHQNVKRMRICWNRILSEEKGGDCFQSKQPYTKWLTLGIGPCGEDGSGSSNEADVKGKAIVAEKKGDSTSSELYLGLTVKVGSCPENGSSGNIYVMNEGKDAENGGENCSSKEDASNKRIEGREESISLDHIPEDILNMIFCKLPLNSLFKLQIVSTSWQSIICNSASFHTMWEQSNVQRWLVMDLYDATNESSNGLALYDVSRRLRYMKVFGEEWSCSNSQWFLRDGDGGLLVYTCRMNGDIRVVNPLTMQFYCLEDARLKKKRKISFYLKKYHSDVVVQIKVDPTKKIYQVIVVIGNLYHSRRKHFIVSIYRSSMKGWEKREVFLEERLYGHTISFFPNIFIQNQNIYLISRNGSDVGKYNLNGDGNIRSIYCYGVNHIHQTLGIVMYKGRMIKVCKGEQVEPPSYRQALIFYELNEVDRQWKLKYEIISPKKLFREMICVEGDYIWILLETGGYVSDMICMDIDSGEIKIWPEVYPFMFDVRKCVSMLLSFCPCS